MAINTHQNRSTTRRLTASFGVVLAFISQVWAQEIVQEAAAQPLPEAEGNAKVLMLVGAFVVGLILFVVIAGKAMGPQRPLDDNSPFFPLDMDDD